MTNRAAKFYPEQVAKPERILDPLHNLIEFSAEEFENTMWRVIQSRPFQRLRRVKQLGFSDFVYPGATHSRFAHSVGVFHTARQLMGVIHRHLGTGFGTNRSQRALAAALVHDVGHGPFSHAFEKIGKKLNLKMAQHENVSVALIEDAEISGILNKDLGGGFANDVSKIIGSKGPGNLYNAVVSSQFDADRLDYMRRDRLMSGTQTGAIDFSWLLANLEIGKFTHGVDEQPIGEIETFVLGPKAIHAAETFVLALFQLYPTVYYHKGTRGAEKIFFELLYRVFTFIADGSTEATGLPSNHPIVRFAKDPNSLDRALDLDDTVIWGALALMADASDSTISGLSLRLRDRKLYKCIDAREKLRHSLAQTLPNLGTDNPKEFEARLDQCCLSLETKAEEWKSTKSKDKARLLIDRDERAPYKTYQESKGPLNQIIIRTAGNELRDIVTCSDVVAAIKPFKVFRLYYDEGDPEAKSFIDKAISQEVQHAQSSEQTSGTVKKDA